MKILLHENEKFTTIYILLFYERVVRKVVLCRPKGPKAARHFVAHLKSKDRKVRIKDRGIYFI